MSIFFKNTSVGRTGRQGCSNVLWFCKSQAAQSPRVPHDWFFVDATFMVCPDPVMHCLIIMVFDRAAYLYVPVMYILMTNENEYSYWYAFASVIPCSDWRIRVRNIHADFETALTNVAEKQFPEADVIGCLFHWKQAIRRYLISKLGVLKEEIGYAMKQGVLDLLTIIPMDEVENTGIPFVRSLIEKVSKTTFTFVYF